LFDHEPFLRPDRNSTARRAQLQSKIAPATAERGAEGVLDGGEHGATLTRSGGNDARNKKPPSVAGGWFQTFALLD